MLRRITAYILTSLFLIGGAFLPLSDFALPKDLPAMYHNYEKLATPEEVGLLDFIGDYLFAGKTLLGHNKNDKPESSSTSVQFQHSPSAFNSFYNRFEAQYIPIKDLEINHTKDYKKSLRF